MIKSAHDEKYQNLLRHLKTVREAQGLTTRALGERLGERSQLISKIELGIRKLSIHEYVQYCDALGIDPLEGIEQLR
jgi:transcriptional regulator with XRE-family HTH domain